MPTIEPTKPSNDSNADPRADAKAHGLYNPENEHDACGVGFVAHIKGKKSHAIIAQGLKILENLSHRGATGYDPLLGDGAPRVRSARPDAACGGAIRRGYGFFTTRTCVAHGV